MRIKLQSLMINRRVVSVVLAATIGIGASTAVVAEEPQIVTQAAAEVVTAEGGKRELLIKELADLMGLREMLAESVRDGESVIKQQMQPMLDKMLRDMGAAEVTDPLMVEFEGFLSAITNAWDIDEATRIYTEVIAEGMSDDDLRASVEFYKTPAGQASVDVGRRANAQLGQYINVRTMAVMQQQMPIFISNIQRIAAEQRAAKTEPETNSDK